MSWEQAGFEFRDAMPPEGMISPEEARAAVRATWNWEGVAEVAGIRFGLLRAPHPATGDVGGEGREPMAWDTPVWIITFSGRWYPRGPNREPHRYHSEKNYVVDATSGAVLCAFSTR